MVGECKVQEIMVPPALQARLVQMEEEIRRSHEQLA